MSPPSTGEPPRPPDKRRDGAILLVVLHTTLVSAHAAAHLAVPVPVASALDALLILGAFYVGPVVGAALLTRKPTAGRWLFLVSFAVGLTYGTFSHFVLPGPDNVASLRPSAWGLAFTLTAAVLAVLEALAVALGVELVRRGRPTSLAPSTPPS